MQLQEVLSSVKFLDFWPSFGHARAKINLTEVEDTHERHPISPMAVWGSFRQLGMGAAPPEPIVP